MASEFQSATSFPKSKINVLLLEKIHPVAEELFSSDGFNVSTVDRALSEEELIKRIPDTHVIGIRSKTKINANVLDHAKKLLSVGCFCIGTNQVDLAKANSLGVPVFNAPFSNTRSVAELILAEIVVLARQLGDRSSELHRGIWNKSATGCHEVRGKTIGIIGYGHIGSQLGVLAEAFGLHVLFHDISKKMPMGNNQAVGSLKELLSKADFVSLHVPATPETKGMIGKSELRSMKPGSCLLNASRGSVVDIDALAQALKDKHLSGAAVDVYPQEPRTNGQGFESPLCGLDNVFLTPHIGGSTEEAQAVIGREVAQATLGFVNTGSTADAVNFPQVDMPLREGSHRILNTHQNVPGVMKSINQIFSERNANIHAQQLATDDKLGYLVTDLDKKLSVEIRDAIASLSTSIRTRILY